LVLGQLASGLLSEHRRRLPSLPGLSICRRFTDSMVTVIASGSSRRWPPSCAPATCRWPVVRRSWLLHSAPCSALSGL